LLRKHYLSAPNTICLERHSREDAPLPGTNVIPAQAGIHNPVSDGIMDPRMREDDTRGVFYFQIDYMHTFSKPRITAVSYDSATIKPDAT